MRLLFGLLRAASALAFCALASGACWAGGVVSVNTAEYNAGQVAAAQGAVQVPANVAT
jgi:hypothetical protein